MHLNSVLGSYQFPLAEHMGFTSYYLTHKPIFSRFTNISARTSRKTLTYPSTKLTYTVVSLCYSSSGLLMNQRYINL